MAEAFFITRKERTIESQRDEYRRTILESLASSQFNLVGEGLNVIGDSSYSFEDAGGALVHYSSGIFSQPRELVSHVNIFLIRSQLSDQVESLTSLIAHHASFRDYKGVDNLLLGLASL